jgi:hypothetical protein
MMFRKLLWLSHEMFFFLFKVSWPFLFFFFFLQSLVQVFDSNDTGACIIKLMTYANFCCCPFTSILPRIFLSLQTSDQRISLLSATLNPFKLFPALTFILGSSSAMDWAREIIDLFCHSNKGTIHQVVQGLRTRYNGEFDATILMDQLDHLQTPDLHWAFTSTAAMIGAAICTFAIDICI